MSLRRLNARRKPPKTRRVTVALTDEEYEKAAIVAAEGRWTLARWCRDQIIEVLNNTVIIDPDYEFDKTDPP